MNTRTPPGQATPSRRFAPQSRARRIASTLLTAVALTGAISGLVVVGCVGLSRSLPAAAIVTTMPMMMTEATGADASRWLARADITPKHLAAAAVDDEEVDDIFTAARAHLTEHMGTLASAESTLTSARNAAHVLIDKMQSGRASDEEAEGLGAAQSALTSAEGAMNSALNSFRTAALASLTSEQRTALTNLRANHKWGLPAPYRTVNRTDEQWLALRNALAHVRIMSERPGGCDQAIEGAVETANTEVSDSIAAYANLPQVQSAWSTAATPQ